MNAVYISWLSKVACVKGKTFHDTEPEEYFQLCNEITQEWKKYWPRKFNSSLGRQVQKALDIVGWRANNALYPTIHNTDLDNKRAFLKPKWQKEAGVLFSYFQIVWKKTIIIAFLFIEYYTKSIRLFSKHLKPEFY